MRLNKRDGANLVLSEFVPPSLTAATAKDVGLIIRIQDRLMMLEIRPIVSLLPRNRFLISSNSVRTSWLPQRHRDGRSSDNKQEL